MAQAFIDNLKATFPDLEVDYYPDKAVEYQLAHRKGAVLITLQNRAFQEGVNSDGSGQINEPLFQITYLSRSLVGKEGIPSVLDLLDQGRESLKELDFDRGKANITSEFFIEVRPGGVWVYGQTWKHTDFFE